MNVWLRFKYAVALNNGQHLVINKKCLVNTYSWAPKSHAQTGQRKETMLTHASQVSDLRRKGTESCYSLSFFFV